MGCNGEGVVRIGRVRSNVGEIKGELGHASVSLHGRPCPLSQQHLLFLSLNKKLLLLFCIINGMDRERERGGGVRVGGDVGKINGGPKREGRIWAVGLLSGALWGSEYTPAPPATHIIFIFYFNNSLPPHLPS